MKLFTPKKILPLAAVAIATVAVAVTNITFTVPLPDYKHADMLLIVSNKNTTIEAFFNERVIQEVDGQRLGMLIELWQNATPAQQSNVFFILRNP